MKPTRSDHMSDEDLARRGLSRETDLRLDPLGDWYQAGVRVVHPGIADAFARWIDRTEGGRYALRNDLHYVYVQVEGAPLHGRGVRVEGSELVVELSGGVEEPLVPSTLRAGPDGVLYCDGRDGTWPIRLSPSAALALESLLEEAGDEVVLRWQGRDHPVRGVEDPLQPTKTATP